MIIALIFLVTSLTAFDHSDLKEKYERQMYIAPEFSNYLTDYKHLADLTQTSMFLQIETMNSSNKLLQHKYKIWYKDLQMKNFIIYILWRFNSREKVDHKRLSKPYYLDNFLGSSDTAFLLLSATQAFTFLDKITSEDQKWLSENKPTTTNLFPKNRSIYFKFLMWQTLESYCYDTRKKKKYAEIIQELLQDFPIFLHDIPSVIDYIVRNESTYAKS